MSEQAKPPRAPLEARYNFHINAVMALCFGIPACILGFGLVRGLVYGIRADKTGEALLVAGGFVALLAAAVYNGAMLFDNRIVVTLTAEGLRDRRTGNVLIPWTMIARLRKVASPDSSGIVRFELTEDPGPRVHYDLMSSSGRFAAPLISDGRQINVETASLDIDQDEFIKAALDFAPHIVVGPLL
jgi:hypothetical protein